MLTKVSYSMIDGAPFNVLDFGATGDGVADDTVAIQSALEAVKTAGGGFLYLPAGVYSINNALVLTGIDNMIFAGAGDDATIIQSTSATNDVFFDSGTSFWRTFRDFSISSSVTKTAGNSFNLAGERRGLFNRVRITGHFNGFNFVGFEQTELISCSITKPSGAGAAIICGTPGAAGQCANLLINSCFLRGQDDVTQTNTLGNYGIVVYDVDAVWSMDTDIGGFLLNDMLIEPTTRSANHYFTQCFFDATKGSDCVTIQGAGTKQQITFNGCWFSSAGKLTGGNVEACGVRAYNTGVYQDIIFSGCRLYNCSGSGLLAESTNCDFTISGCNFYFNGSAAVTNRYGFFWSPASVGSIGPNLTGCRFAGNTPNGLRFDTNARNYSVVGSNVQDGLSNAGTGGILSKNPGYNPVSSTVTVTASPFSYTNNSGDTQTIVVAGGTVSAITLNGLAVGAATNTSVSVPNAGTIVITYSSLPTVLAVGT
jgi:hypothetical protein